MIGFEPALHREMYAIIVMHGKRGVRVSRRVVIVDKVCLIRSASRQIYLVGIKRHAALLHGRAAVIYDVVARSCVVSRDTYAHRRHNLLLPDIRMT